MRESQRGSLELNEADIGFFENNKRLKWKKNV